MIKKDEFKINNRIEIKWDDGYYKSIIQDVDDENIYINIPVKDGSYLSLSLNERITALYFEGERIFKFRTIVTCRKIDKIMVIGIRKPERVVRSQRRNFVRVSVILKTCIALINSQRDEQDIQEIYNSNKSNTNIKFIDANILDISGGGLKLSCKKDLNIKQEIIVNIPFEGKNMILKGRVIRKYKDNCMNIYGVKFLEIDNKNREKIIRFIFHTMRKQVNRA